MKNRPPRALTILFRAAALAAIVFIAWRSASALLVQRENEIAHIPRLRGRLVAELRKMGLEMIPPIEMDGSIRFRHSATLSADDLLILINGLMGKHNLNLTAAVNYEERRELFVELSQMQEVVARFIFSSSRSGARIGPEGELAQQVRGRIGLIIDDFGYTRNRITRQFMKLDANLTFAIVPGERYSRILADETEESGHQVIVHMPMEPLGYAGGDESDYMLKSGMKTAEARERVRRAFRELPQAVGMNNHQGSRATADSLLMALLAEELKRQGKYFIDSYTTPKTQALKLMRKRGVRGGGRQVFLDHRAADDPEYIRGQLQGLAALAEREGMAIGIGHARLNTLAVLMREIPRLQDDGYEFVFVSEVVQ